MIRRAFNAADAALLKLHQWAVDLSGRSPAWWAEQCAYANGAAVIATFCLRPTRGALVLLTTILLLAYSAAAAWGVRSGRIVGHEAVPTMRRLCLGLLGVCIGCDVLLLAAGVAPMAPHQWTIDIGMAVWTALHYFASCRPPAPRPPKRSAAMAGGAA